MSTKIITKYGDRLANPAGVIIRYNSKLQYLVGRMIEDMKKGINNIYKNREEKIVIDSSKDTSSLESKISILSTYISSKWRRIFQDKAPSYATNMTIQTNVASKISVKNSINKLSEGFIEKPIKITEKSITIKSNFLSPEIKDMSREIISKNIDLIKKIPGEYTNQFQKPEVKEQMIEAISKGDLNELNKIINKYSSRTERRAQLLAEGEVRKSFNEINLVRLKENGINKFEWLHSGGGQHPREQHMEWDGEIFSIDNLPFDDEAGEQVYPGQLYNCGCTANPVIEIEV